ncbi:MAG: DUF4912 domain-containing protein [Candidatus Kaelpia aquatica]|nr:DUF4912 domain-containing protein [Candidatus Kaelpia aquatica]
MGKDLTKLKRIELLELAKKRKIKGVSILKKAELIKILSKDLAKKAEVKGKIEQKIKRDKIVKKIKPKKKTSKPDLRKKKTLKIKKIAKESLSQELIELTKFQAGTTDRGEEPRSQIGSESPEIKHHYGEDSLALLVRDPWWLFSYWEIRGQLWEDTRLRCGSSGYKEVLRVYDVTGVEFKDSKSYNSYFDIELTPFIECWYINVKDSGRSYVAEVGLRTDSGKFFTIIRSNVVVTPRYGPSELVDEEWMVVDEDYWKMFALSGGYGVGVSSEELQKVLKQRRLDTISSSTKGSLEDKR